jgi:hypothetical protein
MQSGVSGDSLISRKREELYIIIVTDAEDSPAPFKYSVDRDDDEVLVIIGSGSHKVVTDGCEIERSDQKVKQSVEGRGNQIIGSVNGGIVLGNITGDLHL